MHMQKTFFSKNAVQILKKIKKNSSICRFRLAIIPNGIKLLVAGFSENKTTDSGE